MFEDCASLSNFPDVSKWDTRKINYMGNFLKGCTSLGSIADISKWNCSNLVFETDIYCGCITLLFRPIIKKRNSY